MMKNATRLEKIHPRVHVGVHVRHCLGVCSAALGNRRLSSRFIFFHHERRLPVEKIGRNRRTEQADHGRK
jgi:hypothetical protein